jgi:uncharacterized protein YacL
MKKTKLIIGVVISLIIIVLAASIIQDILYLIFGNILNKTLLFIISIILTYAFIEFYIRTAPGKYIIKELDLKLKKKKK